LLVRFEPDIISAYGGSVMNIIDTEMLWRQFGATIEMLDNALRDCPDELWEQRMWADPYLDGSFTRFWYVSYHTLFWLDYYLSGDDADFRPPEPFTLGETEPGVLPPRTYTRAELLGYLAHCREKCQETLGDLTGEQADRTCTFPWGSLLFAELLLDNLRHVQEHGAQLRMFLGQQAGMRARWVARGG
jgi:hypothetical protein